MRIGLMTLVGGMALLCGSCSQSEGFSLTSVWDDIVSSHSQGKCYKEEMCEKVKAFNRLTLVKMTITKTATKKDEAWYKAGKRIAIYTSDWYLTAFVDLSKLNEDDFEWDDDAKTVNILLPAVEIDEPTRSGVLEPVYKNIGTLRSDMGAFDRGELLEMANKSFKAEVEDNPKFRDSLTRSAEDKARRFFVSFFQTKGYAASVNFRKK